MPKKGYVWSERLGKWRRPAIRKFMMDRQGVHIILGFLVNLLGVGAAFAVMMLTKHTLAGILVGVALVTVATHVFLRYEEVEAAEIEDDGYIDIGGYLGGMLACAALVTTVGILLKVLL